MSQHILQSARNQYLPKPSSIINLFLLTFALQKSSIRPFLLENDRTTLSWEEKRPIISYSKV